MGGQGDCGLQEGRGQAGVAYGGAGLGWAAQDLGYGICTETAGSGVGWWSSPSAARGLPYSESSTAGHMSRLCTEGQE